MAELTIIADVRAAPGQDAAVRTALLDLATQTRAEAGCIRYDIHQDTETPAHFLIYETWESRAHWQDHITSAHFVAHTQATALIIAATTLSEMTKIG
jgi:quinol monooxygenase YgiN